MNWKGLPLAIFGSGGISKETYNLIKHINSKSYQSVYDFIGFIESDKSSIGKVVIDGYTVVTCDESIFEFADKYPTIGMVIPVGNPIIKEKIFRRIQNIPNVVFPNIIYPSIEMDSESIKLGFGNVITAGVNLTCDIKIGNFNLINLNSTIGHDTTIGDFNVVNPLVAISGEVRIGNACLIGTGAKILQQLLINDNCTVGAGSVVTKNTEPNSTIVGMPARRVK